jgi:hypothetical protein
MTLRKPSRWSALAIAISILQLPLIALADDHDPETNPTIDEMPDMNLGTVHEHGARAITAGGGATVVTGGANDSTTASGHGSAGIRYYRLRLQPGGGGVIRDEDLNVSAELGGGSGGFVAGTTGRLRLGIGWGTGNDGANFYGLFTGEGRLNLHSSSVQGNTASVSPGVEAGLVVATSDALTLTLAPTFAARVGDTGDGNVVAGVVGGRARLASGDRTYLTLDGGYTVLGTGEGRTGEIRLGAVHRITDRVSIGGDLSVAAISNRAESGIGASTENVTTVVPAVNGFVGVAF